MRFKVCAIGAVAIVGAGAASSAWGGEGPPPPRAATGSAVQLVGTGVPTPTAFAFGKGNVFVAGFGDPEGKGPKGGIYVLRNGRAVKVPGLPGAAGLAWKNGTLYASAYHGNVGKLVAWSGWNGTAFTEKRIVWSPSKRFPGLNGLAFGPDGRLYAGVSFGDGDTKKSRLPYAQSVVSLRIDGTDVKTVATGMRQPWQLAFVKGVRRPFVTVLGPENLGKKMPPDYVAEARDGDDYGFPACNWARPATCSEFARPLVLLPAHSSPTGIGALGSTLYVALFTGAGRGPEVITVPSSGGSWKPFLTGFAAPVVAVGVSGGRVYAGDLTGSIYRVRA